MKLKDHLKTALTGLQTNKVRSILTILGIVIGISAVTTALSIGGGAEKLILSQISSLGSNNIFIEPGAWSERMERGSFVEGSTEEAQIKTLKYSDAKALKRLPLIKNSVPFAYGVDRIVANGEDKKVSFLGTDHTAQLLTNDEVIYGRNLTQEDVVGMKRVVVLGYNVWQDLFGDNDPVGDSVRIKKTKFRVIGVLEEKGPQAFANQDDSISVPITTAQNLLLPDDSLRFIVTQAQNEKLIEPTVTQIRNVLRTRHNINNPTNDPAKDDFKVVTQKDAERIVGNVTGIFTVLVASIAAISLVVGGVGIMNIMLVSVSERTKEIGLRKAVGAKKKDILLQFLFEAVLLTLAGGILGIILGSLLSYVGSIAFRYILGSSWGFFVPFKAFLLGFGVSFVVGMTFGLYPARKASRLSPIEALRYE